MLNLETVKTIAYLGPQASFTEMAKDKFCKRFNISAYPTPLQTIRQVVEYVDENENSLGVLAVENSIEGTVRESLDNLMITKIQISKFFLNATCQLITAYSRERQNFHQSPE